MLQSHDKRRGTTAATLPQGQRVPLELWLLGLGLLLCMGVLIRGRIINSDRFLYPKEFVFQLFALAMALIAMARAGALRVAGLDALLLGFLGWSAMAAVGAANPWWACNAVGTTAASLAVFWVSRTLRDQGHERVLLLLIALAVTIVASSAVAEAFGLFRLSVGRLAPGGVLGHRNQMAHLVVLGTPALLLCAIGLRRRLHVALTALAIAAIAAALVLSRSRGAWLAGMVTIGWLLLTLPLTRRSLRQSVSPRRWALWLGAVAVGAGAAVLLPNALDWRSKSPYWSSFNRILDYESGSGRGRLLQQANTSRMIRDHPIVGVGPRNWSVRYPQYAPAGDPTLKPEDVIPVWRYPHGEWLGTAAELGLPGLAMLLVAGGVLLRSAWRNIRRHTDPESVLRGLTLSATLVSIGVTGLFDPVIRLPATGFLVCVILGVLAPREQSGLLVPRVRSTRWIGLACVLLALGPGTASTAGQLWAASMYSREATPARLTRAVGISPGEYRAHVLLARSWVEHDRCDLAWPHIHHALALYPAESVPAQLHLQCVGMVTGAR